MKHHEDALNAAAEDHISNRMADGEILSEADKHHILRAFYGGAEWAEEQWNNQKPVTDACNAKEP